MSGSRNSGERRLLVKCCLAALAIFPLQAQPLQAAAAQPVTYGRDIAPIFHKNCVSCHRPGEAAPFSLLTFEDARKHAPQIAAVTKSRAMPPWLPEPGYGDFADAQRLSDAEIRTIAEWVSAGAPEGAPAAIPEPAASEGGWQLGPPDLILEAPKPYTLAATGPDVFRNFVFTPPIAATRYVRAIEIRPGNKRLVHHANLIVDRLNSARKNGLEFAGMDLNIRGSVFDPPGHFLFWKPGSAPYSEPDGFAWRLEPGNDLVLNAHLQPDGKPETIQPSIGLYFTSDPPVRHPLLIQLEDDGALNIPAGAHDFVVADDFQIPVDADAIAIYPHAHYLGKLLEGYATLPDGARKWLIRIPDWDLNRQSVYRYREPVFLPKGTVISMRFHYDNSTANVRNPNRPPKRVIAGNDATDEMGHLWLQVVPRGEGDRRRQVEEALVEHRVVKYPDDAPAWLNLGELKLSRLDAQGAAAALERAVRTAPAESQPHNVLGAAYTRVGRSAEALHEFETAIRIDGSNVNARYNLVYALARAGRTGEAVTNLQQVSAAFPKDAALHNVWGELLLRENKSDEAVAQFDQALQLDPKLDVARENRDYALAQGKHKKPVD